MNFIPSKKIKYTDYEEIKLNELQKLFSEWFEAMKQIKFSQGYTENDLVWDGFYPYYLKQKIKILYIGRESRGISGYNYIDILFDAYKKQYIDNQHINSSFFHKRLMYITYGLNNGMPQWHTIPNADEITIDFGTEKGISFAFMNISKFSNDSKVWNADWQLIEDSFIASSNVKRNFIQEQVEILEPDLIITMNLEDKINALGKITEIQKGNKLNSYWLENSKNKLLLLDTFHFTAMKKDDLDDFYEPICEAVKKNLKI